MQMLIIYLATFGMIFLDFVLKDISDHKSNFVGKKRTLPYKIFL